MPRKPLPSEVLDLRGSFKVHPETTRTDPEGQGPLNPLPPSDLPPEIVPYWHHAVARLPKVTWTSSDEYAVEQIARTRYAIYDLDKECGGGKSALDPRYAKLDAAMAVWIGRLGMSPGDRARMGKVIGSKKQQNRFTKLQKAG